LFGTKTDVFTQFIVTSTSYLEKLSGLFMAVGRSAPRYQMMGLLYAKSKSLQSSLSEYFIVVVRLCHHMLNLTQRSIIGQFVSSLNDSHIKGFQSELDSWANAIKEEVALAMGQTIEDEGQENSRFRALSTKSSETASHRARMKMNLRVLDLCSTYDYETTWKQTRKRGNATLFNNSNEYQNWKTGAESRTLVYRGKLGSGKSVLLANIVEDLNLHFQNKNIGLAYFFCRHDILESLKARTVIGSLARQLLSSMPDLSVVGDLCANSPTLDIEAISKVLHRVLPRNFNICFVLDGLDECSGDERAMVEQELRTLQTRFTLLLCISSRIEADAGSKEGYEHFATPSIILLPDDNPDIEGFISAELESCIMSRKLQIGDPSLILEIEDALLRGAQGMFLWVALQIESLCAEKTDKAIRQALKNLPKSLSETFSRILATSLHFAESYQARILKLVTVAKRPLTTEELREALSVNPGDTNWNPAVLLNNLYSTLTCCGSLVIVDEEEMTVRLVHHSVKNFLLRSAKDPSGIPFTIDSADMEMADVIVTYLNYGIFDTQVSSLVVPQIAAASAPSTIIHSILPPSSGVRSLALKLLKSRKQPNCDVGQILSEASEHFQPKSVNRFPFYDYAKSNWMQHVRCKLRSEPLKYDLLLRLLEKKVLDLDITDDSGRTFLSLAVENGHTMIVRLLLEHGVRVDSRDSLGQTPLWWAIKAQRATMARLLLEKGADIGSVDDVRYPLLTAVRGGNYEIVGLLLEKGADIGSVDDVRYPLLTAVRGGNYEIVELLLEKGADIGSLNDVRHALLTAVKGGSYEIVELLLEKGANIESVNDARHALLTAVKGGSYEIVEWLLEKGADPDLERLRDTLRYPLLIAAKIGHYEILQLLLEKGVDVRDKDKGGRPLLEAAKNGHYEIVKLLLEKGAPIEYGDNSGTPLSHAAINGHDMVVELLLDAGANMNHASSVSHQMLLSKAAEQGHDRVVEILLENGAQIDAKDGFGRTALLLAAEQGHNRVVKILLEEEALIDSRGDSGCSTLVYAVQQGHDRVVEILLENRAYIDTKDSLGRTALSWAAEQGNDRVVKILLEKGAQIDSRGDSGRSALLYAVQQGHDRVVEILLENGAQIDAKDGFGRTALLWAAEQGNDQVVKILLEKGALIDLRANSGRSALVCAAQQGHDRVVEILLEKGAKVDLQDYLGYSAISYATRQGHDQVVKILREKGAQID
jgi:ankyrin repeat protein